MKVTLKIEGNEYFYDKGTSYEDIVREFQPSHDNLIALVIENGKLKELFKTAEADAEVSFITRKEETGRKVYARTASFLLCKAIYDVTNGDLTKAVKIEFSIGRGYYISPRKNLVIDAEFVAKVKARMESLISQDANIIKRSLGIDAAKRLFKEAGMDDKVRLFKYRRSNNVNVYELDGYFDYFYGYMLPSAGYIEYFDLIPYDKGMMLMLPGIENPKEVPVFDGRTKLFNALNNATVWNEKMDISTVGDLNEHICKGTLSDVIMVAEALQERRIAEIAKEVAEREGVKFVMIAGPSSSGKTSFSHRLSIQLSTYGLKPHPIAVDDYFVNREDTPKDENGNYNFECIEAIDTKQFNEDMLKLLAGEEVELPTFNFKTGQREYRGNVKKLGKDDILVIEGIHCLNDKMSYALPKESKFKIYISALTSLNIDEHNRIATTDGRLLRRMVRDARTRGTSAQGTIRMWQSVRKGEEENIFPFQEEADATFNSALIYELSVLKQFAEPLLFAIEPGEPEYYEAKRLLKFLDYFLGISSENLPNNSLVREFVGGSCFPV